jgi:hypothetical protein
LAILFAISAVILAFVDGNAPIYDGSTNSAVGILLYCLALGGLSGSIFGNNFVLTAIVSALVGLAFQLNITRSVRRKTKKFVEKIQEIEEFNRNARQIFVGTGNIQFSFGSNGFLVDGDVLDFRLGWRVFDGHTYIKMEPLKNKKGEWQGTDLDLAEMHDATHLLLFIKSGLDTAAPESKMPNFVLLVVPRARFFSDRLGSTDWIEFCESFERAVQNAI